jgi:DNA-binding NarL/FixJ family response regulator
MNRVKLLLVDDHQIVLEGLKNMLQRDFDIVGTLENGLTLAKTVRQLRPDVVIADISMPMLNGLDAVRQMRKAKVDTKVIFLTMHNDSIYAKQAFEIGASGFVLKHSACSELVTAINGVLRGHTYISPAIAEDLIYTYRHDTNVYDDSSFGNLTDRQRQVLQLIAEGKSAKEIAAILNISTRTVEFHKYTMMQNLRIKTSAQLVQFAIKHGVIVV